MANMATRISIYADDKASASFRRVGGEADSLAKKIDALNALGPGLRNVFAGLGVSVGFGQAIRQAAAFETALVSMRRVTSRSASELKADIAGLGPELGSQTQLMQGLYTVYSSGVTEAAKAVDLLSTASKASKVSGVSQAQAVDALTSLMTGYTGELNRAAEASDLLFAIEKQGKTTVGEVIPVIGELASVSKQANISADEMGAQFSALTLTSGGTAKAATQYKAAVMELLRPNEKLAGLIGRLGYESGTAMVKQNGLARTWRMLDAAARQSGSSLAQFLSSEESLVGLAPQLETAFAQHAANLDAMNKKTGETDASFARWKETLNGLKDTTANMLDNLGTQGGNLFAPAAAEGLRQLNDVLKLLSDNFDTVAAGTVVLGSGLTGMTAAKRLAANETARYAAETIKLEAAQLRGKVTLLGSAQAVAMKAQSDTEAALAARNAARAELERFEAERRSALAVQNGTDNAIIRAAQDRQQLALKQQLTAAETIYQQKLKALPTALGSFSSSLAGVGRMVKTAGSALLGAFGGPVGLAVTALTAGLGYLATRESEAEVFARTHADALMLVSDNAGTAADALESYREKLKQMDATQLAFEQKQLAESFKKQTAGGLSNDSVYKGILDEMLPSWYNVFDSVPDGFEEKLRKIIFPLSDTAIASTSSEQMKQIKKDLMDLAVQYDKTGEASKAIEKVVDPVIALKVQQEAVTAQAGQMASGIQNVGDSAREAASGVNSLVVELNKIDPKRFETAVERLKFKAYVKTLKGVERYKAETLKGEVGLSTDAIKGVMSGNKELLTPGISELLSLAGQAYTPSKKTKGSASKAESAKTYLQGVEAEIARLLNNGGEAFGVKLDKKLAEIAKRGKDAGLSLSELTAVTTRYAEAANADNIRRQSEALDDVALSVARLSGDWRTVNKMELDREADNLTRKLLSLGVAQETVTAKVNEYRAAKEKESQIKDAQAASEFYRDLYKQAGQFGLEQTYNNKLLESQADNLRKNVGISEEYIQQWLKLQQLESSRSWNDGIARASLSYVSTATDAASQMENLFTNAFQTIGNVGGSALEQVFNEGRFAADEFFANLTRQLAVQSANAATNQLIGGILGLLTNSLSGMFSGGSFYSGKGTGFAGYDAALGQHVANVPIHHSGGIVGMGGVATRTVPLSLFANAPRYHEGGLLRPDERPAILQTGERVLSRSDNANMGAKLDVIADKIEALASAIQNSTGGGSPNIVIVDDNSKIEKYMRSPEGARTFLFQMNQNRAAVKNVAQGGRA